MGNGERGGGGGKDKYLIRSSFRSLKRGASCEAFGGIETLEGCQVGRQFVVFLSGSFLGALLTAACFVFFGPRDDPVSVIMH